AVELLVACPHRLVAGIELGHAGRARPAVEIGDAQPVAATLERQAEERELARVEDGLVAYACDPPLRPDANAERPGDARDLGGVVGDRPAVAVPGDEQARMRRPRLRPPADRQAAQGRADATDV